MTMKENAPFASIQMHSKMKNVNRVPTQKRLKISNASHVAKIKFKLFSRNMFKSGHLLGINQAFLNTKKRSCECSFGYPETTNEETGELECLETAFDEVLIDDDLTQAGFSCRRVLL